MATLRVATTSWLDGVRDKRKREKKKEKKVSPKKKTIRKCPGWCHTCFSSPGNNIPGKKGRRRRRSKNNPARYGRGNQVFGGTSVFLSSRTAKGEKNEKNPVANNFTPFLTPLRQGEEKKRKKVRYERENPFSAYSSFNGRRKKRNLR